MSEGLAQGPYMATEMGFEPSILLTQGTELTTETPRPTNKRHDNNNYFIWGVESG